MLELKTKNEGCVQISGAVEMPSLLGLRKELEGQIRSRKGSELVIDLSELKTFNSSVLSLLLCLIRKSRDVNCDLKFEAIPSGLFDMARVGGVESFLPKGDI